MNYVGINTDVFVQQNLTNVISNLMFMYIGDFLIENDCNCDIVYIY